MGIDQLTWHDGATSMNNSQTLLLRFKNNIRSAYTQGGLFFLLTVSLDCICVVLWEFGLKLSEIHEVHVRSFAACKAFLFLFVVVVFSSLTNYFGFRTTNVRVKTDHSVSLRWNKTFWTFPKKFVLYFSDNRAFDLWVDFVSSASPSFAWLN